MIFSLTYTSYHDYPHSSKPQFFRNRAKAADAFYHLVLDLVGYPDEDVDPEDLEDIRRLTMHFVEGDDEVEWVVNNNGPSDEMTTIQLFAVQGEP